MPNFRINLNFCDSCEELRELITQRTPRRRLCYKCYMKLNASHLENSKKLSSRFNHNTNFRLIRTYV